MDETEDQLSAPRPRVGLGVWGAVAYFSGFLGQCWGSKVKSLKISKTIFVFVLLFILVDGEAY